MLCRTVEPLTQPSRMLQIWNWVYCTFNLWMSVNRFHIKKKKSHVTQVHINIFCWNTKCTKRILKMIVLFNLWKYKTIFEEILQPSKYNWKQSSVWTVLLGKGFIILTSQSVTHLMSSLYLQTTDWKDGQHHNTDSLSGQLADNKKVRHG